MAEQKSRIYSLPEITEINDDMYLMLDASDTGARRFNLKTFYDKVDGVQASANAANTAATAAAAAVDSANQAAQQAASAAESASTTVQGLVDDVNEAIEAVGDVTEQAMPLMNATTRGGAKLGMGLEVTDGTLSVNTTASGDGSQAGPILSLNAKGLAEQSTTTGKNLLPITATSKTVNGVTFTVNADGSVTANGTANAGIVFFTTNGVVIPSGSYYISGCPTGGSASVYGIRVGSDAFQSDISDYGQGRVATITSEATCRVYIFISSGYTCNNLTFYPQLELGSTATSYEPYTGGAPSPSPDYPQEIWVVRGRNLFDKSTLVNKPWNSSDNIPTRARMEHSIRLPIGTTVTLSLDSEFFNTYRVAVLQANEDAPATNPAVTDTGWITSGRTFTTIAKYIYVNIKRADDGAVDIADLKTRQIQLERGSVAHPYVPYGDYVGLEAQGKNLFDKSTALEDRYVNDGSGGIASNTTTNTYASDFIRVVAGATYSMTNTGARMWGAWYNASKQYISGFLDYAVSHTAPTNAAYMRLTVLKDFIETFQVEANDHATAYEPYYHTTTPVPLPSRGWVAALPDGTADVLTLDGAGKVVWTEQTDINTLNITGGSAAGEFDNVNGFSIYGNIHAWGLLDADIARNHYPMYASHLMSVTVNNSNFTNVILKGSGSVLVINIAGATSVSEVREAVNALGCEVLYPLATPVTEDCGYVEGWPTNLPSGCQISIPELDDLNISYHIDESVMEIARQWYERARSEYADELLELRMTVNELATRIQ